MPKPEEQRRPLTLFISLAALFTTSLLGALASRQMAMHYGASTFGTLALATSFAIAFQTLTEFGQIQVLQRELVQSEKDQSRLISMAIALRAAIMLVSLPAAYAIGWVLYRNTDNAYSIIAIMVISVPIGSMSQVFFGYFANRFQNRQQALYQVGQQSLMLTGVSILVAHHRPLTECALVIVGSSFITLTAMWAQVSRSVQLSLAWDGEHARWFLREAAPIGLSTVLLAFYQRADVLLLGIESTTKQVGYYGIVIAINSFFVMMP
ncbi:MAG: oligosaccharide flippase family protein, partial [Actinobacteria bacterium]|nr:oligosaccharide flippase family protein [Actinomycetota bacterium]